MFRLHLRRFTSRSRRAIAWAVQIPKTRLGDVVLIFGHGQRGLGAVVAAKRAGASTVIITGTSRSRHKLEIARALGADHCIAADEENVVERVHAITGGRGVDVILDVVPVATEPILDAIEVARTGATIVFSGIKGKPRWRLMSIASSIRNCFCGESIRREMRRTAKRSALSPKTRRNWRHCIPTSSSSRKRRDMHFLRLARSAPTARTRSVSRYIRQQTSMSM